MAQFAVYRNRNPKTRTTYPYLLDVQSDLLSDLHTRVVIPLAKAAALRRRPIRGLTPVVELDGEKLLLLVPQLAGIARSELGTPVANVSACRPQIVAALDLLITGI